MKLRRSQDREVLQRGGKILATILSEVVALVRPGISTKDLDDAAARAMKAAGVEGIFLGYHGYPSVLCTSRNERVVHGIPDAAEMLNDGDILGIDIGIRSEGLITDMAVTVPVGEISAEARKLLFVGKTALEKAIDFVRPGVTTGDLGAMVQSYVEGEGFGVIRDLVGHGVGHKLHEDLMIPNFGIAGRGPAFEEGMVIAIEPMIAMGDWHVKTLQDGWTVVTKDGSLAAHFEHTMIVTKDGVRVVTAA